MSAPLIRDEVHDAWRGILIRNGCQRDMVDALVLELDQACEGHGAPLPRRPRPEDPNAVALGPLPAPADPAVIEAAAARARASLRPYGGVDRRAETEPLDQLPDLPEGPQ